MTTSAVRASPKEVRLRNNNAPPYDLLDAGIKRHVWVLHEAGIETFESCEGGEGHAFHEPTVRFHGGQEEGFRALAVALQHDLRVFELRRYYVVIDREPVGPYWEMTFVLPPY